MQLSNVNKSFGPVKVLHDVSIDLRAGEVHALIGENGAGKSTLMKVLAGVHPFDGGELRLDGMPVRFRNVSEARAAGVVMVYQELLLLPALSVAENLFLGQGGPWINYRNLYRRAEELLESINLSIDVRREVGTLDIGQQQLVELASALALNGRILIMDEPTAALTAAETETLFGLIERLKRQGTAIVYISHRLEEVFRISDRITILRDGRHVATLDTAATGPAEVIPLMVGRALDKYVRESTRLDGPPFTLAYGGDRIATGEIVLRPGEIVGLAGVIGSGRSELIRSLFGLHGRASLGGTVIRNPDHALKLGLAFVPGDRKSEGLVLSQNVRENLTLASLARLSTLGVMRRGRERNEALRLIRELNLRPPEPEKPVDELSGGNQQKVVVGKVLATRPRILLLDEPTRGVDVGARAELYDEIDELARAGLGILVSSGDTGELTSLADRILVLRDGRVTAELHPPFDDEEVVGHVTGAHQLA